MIVGGYNNHSPKPLESRAGTTFPLSEDWRPKGWINVIPVKEVDQSLLLRLGTDVILYNRDVKPTLEPIDSARRSIEEELDAAFLQVQLKMGEKYANSMWHMLHQQYRDYETSIEARMKVEDNK